MTASLLSVIEDEDDEQEVCRRVSELVDQGWDVNAADDFGTTPLHSACRCNRPSVAELLISRGARLLDTDRDGVAALYLAAHGGFPDIVRLLLRSGLNDCSSLNLHCIEGCTAFYAACHQGHTDVAELLFRAGADPNLPDDQGNTPLMSAVVGGRTEVVGFLGSIGVDVSAANNNSMTAVDMAYLTQRKHLLGQLIASSRGRPLPASSYRVCMNGGCSSTEGLRSCETCKSVFYCSSDCQQRDMRLHRQHCTSVQQEGGGLD